MKKADTAKKTAYIGAGAGLAAFAMVGLLPGSFLGGVVGLNIAGALFGLPLTSALLPRMIVAVSMMMGVFVSALMFVSATGVMGWMVGAAVETVKGNRVTMAEAGK